MSINTPGVPSAEDFFGGESLPSVKFPTLGTSFSGVVKAQRMAQVRDYRTGEPEFWKDGQPKMQAILTCIDSASGDEVNLYMKGRMLTAGKQAVRAAGLTKGFEPGTKVTVTFTGEIPSPSGGYPAKEYTVEVQAPSLTDVRTDEQVPTAQAVAATPTASDAPQVAIPTEGLTPEAHAALVAAGLIK